MEAIFLRRPMPPRGDRLRIYARAREMADILGILWATSSKGPEYATALKILQADVRQLAAQHGEDAVLIAGIGGGIGYSVELSRPRA
jgi:hypothetical protein